MTRLTDWYGIEKQLSGVRAQISALEREYDPSVSPEEENSPAMQVVQRIVAMPQDERHRYTDLLTQERQLAAGHNPLTFLYAAALDLFDKLPTKKRRLN